MRSLALALALAALAAPARAAEPQAPAPPAKPAAKPAAPARKVRQLAGETVQFKTRDGWTLSGTYWPSKREDKLTFVLLHDARGRSSDWYWLARGLSSRGIGWLAFDLRGHGQSQTPPEGSPASWPKFRVSKTHNEWDNMREDAAAAVAFLKERGVPEEAAAFGGGDVGGSVALKYAAVHPAVPMVLLLSPGMSYRDVITVNAVRAYRGRPILMVVADDDRRSSTETPILHQFARLAAGAERAALVRVARGHGTGMLASNRGLVARILDWIEDPVAAPPPAASSATAPGDLPDDAQLEELYGGAKQEEPVY